MTKSAKSALQQARMKKPYFTVGFLTSIALISGLAACKGGNSSDAKPGISANSIRPIEDQSADFMDMARRHSTQLLKISPEEATALGVSDDLAGTNYQSRLGDYSAASIGTAHRLNADFLIDLNRFDRNKLSNTAAVSYEVLRNAYILGAERNKFDFGGAVPMRSSSPYIITQLSGPHLDLPRLLFNQHPLNTAEDLDNYLARLADMYRALTEVRDSVMRDARAGVVPPYFAISGAADAISGIIAPPPSQSPFIKRLNEAMGEMGNIGPNKQEAIINEAIRHLENEIYPAYNELRETLLNLTDQAGTDAGVWRLVDGEQFYQHALNAYGANGLSAEEIHQIGLDEVARISFEMTSILDKLDKNKPVHSAVTLGERFAALADGQNMTYPNNDEGRENLLKELDLQIRAINARAPKWFGTLPEQSVEVKRIPVYEQDTSAGGYYTPPSLDGTRPGIYWINLKDTTDWPVHTLKTLTYHEAVPGHHFQVALQQGIKDMPLIRQMMYYSEFGEGWALYAERVASEMGMYSDDPLGDLGRLQSELFRAARLVVDTGMHHKRWTREQAITYMMNILGDSRASVTREVERYAVWPGQATSYKLGMLKLEALRAHAEAQLGKDFDIRKYHDVILLDGSMPLPVLEAKVDRWIETQQRE